MIPNIMEFTVPRKFLKYYKYLYFSFENFLLNTHDLVSGVIAQKQLH